VRWITMVDQRGIPQPNSVGFVFQDDGSILIYNMTNAKRLSHVVDRPQVSLHFDGDGHGGDIVIFTGTAHRVDDVPPPHQNPDCLAKYGDSLLRVSNSAEEFGNKFSVPLRVEITGGREVVRRAVPILTRTAANAGPRGPSASSSVSGSRSRHPVCSAPRAALDMTRRAPCSRSPTPARGVRKSGRWSVAEPAAGRYIA
jgi:PPOX class probable F420-dependent enzyme